MSATPPVLRLDGVWKHFGDTAVLRGVDLEVHEHEVVALIGRSGSGKSTLLRSIDLLDPISDGRIQLDGDDIAEPEVNADAIRAHIGIVFQSFNLFPHMRVIDNVTLAATHVHGLSKAEAEQRATVLLERVGLGEHARSYPDRLSGGQQQRVAIVRAVLTKPRLLLLDEITSALDPMLVGEVLDLVQELAQGGMTIVMATHEMAFARDVATTVVHLDGGEVVERGPAADVFDNPTDERTKRLLSRIRG